MVKYQAETDIYFYCTPFTIHGQWMATYWFLFRILNANYVIKTCIKH